MPDAKPVPVPVQLPLPFPTRVLIVDRYRILRHTLGKR